MIAGECPTKRGYGEKTPYAGEKQDTSPTSVERRHTRSMVKSTYSK